MVRVTISDRAEGSPRDAAQRVVFGDPHSVGYETFRKHIAEYVSLLPPNSHGEANPADKDPVPPPFDNTYNSPEHDARYRKWVDMLVEEPQWHDGEIISSAIYNKAKAW